MNVPGLLELSRVEAGYGRHAILPPISLSIGAGEIWALLGRNGSGKSTLLHTMLGIRRPVSGRVGRRAGLRVSFVPQRTDQDLSVPARAIDHVRGGVDQGWSFLQPALVMRSRDRIDAAMERAHVLEIARHQMSTLSEGQKQRVFMARALVSDPELIVLDEPTSAMDPVAEEDIFGLVRTLSETSGVSIVIASHHMSFAPRYATHAIYVDADSKTAQIGGVDEVTHTPEFRRRYGSVMRDG